MSLRVLCDFSLSFCSLLCREMLLVSIPLKRYEENSTGEEDHKKKEFINFLNTSSIVLYTK